MEHNTTLFFLKEAFPSIKRLSVMVSALEFRSTTNLNISFYNVSLLKSNWTINGLNLFICEASLAKTEIYLSVKKRASGTVDMYRSTIGHLHVSGKFQIHIADCNINGKIRNFTPVFEVISCEINITNCVFSKNYGGTSAAVVKAYSSQVNIRNVSFSFNYGLNGIIELLDKSNMYLMNCTFDNNGHWYYMKSAILVKSNSSAVISHSRFVRNRAAFGAALCVFPSGSTMVTNSVFQNNDAQRGGVINIHDQPNLLLKKERDTFASQLHKTKSFGIEIPNRVSNDFLTHFQPFFTVDDTMNNNLHHACIVNSSIFMRNYGFESGGVIYVQGRSVHIENSNFTRNLGGFGGAVRGCQNATINVKATIFKNNRALIGATIAAEYSVILSMDQIRFDYNDDWNLTGTAFRLISYSKIRISNSIFINNANVPVVLNVDNFTDVSVINSTFKMHNDYGSSVLYATNNVRVKFANCSFYKHGGFYASENAYVYMEQCSIEGSHHVEMAIIIWIQYSSHLYLNNTNITSTNPQIDVTFLQVDSGSAATFDHCLYIENHIMQGHIVVKGKSTLLIYHCEFKNNRPGTAIFLLNHYVDLIYLENSKLSITGSAFYNNSIVPFLGMSRDSSLIDTLDSNVNITSSLFLFNTADNAVSAENKESSSYVQIHSCRFNNSGSSIKLTNIPNVNIQNVFFQVHIKTHYYNPGTLSIIKGQFIRIAFSYFESNQENPVQINFIQYSFLKQHTQLMTCQTNLSDGKSFLETNAENFFHRATSAGFIKIDHRVAVKVQQEETEYASSKWLNLYRESCFFWVQGDSTL